MGSSPTGATAISLRRSSVGRAPSSVRRIRDYQRPRSKRFRSRAFLLLHRFACFRKQPTAASSGQLITGRRHGVKVQATICQSCRRLPLEKRRCALWAVEIVSFLDQSNISSKNLRRLEKLESEAGEEVTVPASLVKRIAKVHPRRRKRWKVLKQQHPELFQQAVQAGLADYLEPEWSGEDELFDEDVWGGVWIEPRPAEPEPSSEEIRLAQAATALDETCTWLWC